MPHTVIRMFPGRSEEVKKELAEKIAKVIEETAGCPERSISISIQEVEKDSWEDEVYNKEIMTHQDTLYKKPGYGSLAE